MGGSARLDRFVLEGFGKSRDGWISFPALFARKSRLECRKMAKKMVATMETPIQTLGRELLSNGGFSQTHLCLATGLPSWKISRLLKRLELMGFVDVAQELRFSRGRPRKLCKLTASGIEYFTGPEGASDENSAESPAPSPGLVEVSRHA